MGLPLGAADLTPAEQKQVNQIRQSVQAAGKHYSAGRFEQAGAQIKQAWWAIKEVEDGGKASFELQQELMPMVKRIRKAHVMLSMEGITLPPITLPKNFGKPKIREATAMSITQKSVRPGTSPDVPTKIKSDDPLGFTGVIVPILVNRCGNCHIAAAKGGFGMKSYAELMKGPREGVVIFPGDPIGSRLIAAIESGDMPRGGGKVTAEELKLLRDWITAGAKFDGVDQSSPLRDAELASSQPSLKMPVTKPTPTIKSGARQVSFSKEVAGLLIKNCTGCHINATPARGGLRMDNFRQILEGGDSGTLLQVGDGMGSLLVQRLQGRGGDRMPGGGRPPLSEQEIQLISKWIDQGAALDGQSDRQTLQTMHKLATASSASPAEMTSRRAALAEEAMKLTVGDDSPVNITQTEHFQLVGTASEATLQLVARVAEEKVKPATKLVAGELGEGLFAGKATVFVFAKRYDYSEFAKMTEGRSLPSDWTSHWAYDGVHAYLAVVVTDRDSDAAIEDRLAAPLTSVAVATRGGDLPRWFSEGIGVAAAKQRKKLTRAQRSTQALELRSALGQVNSAKQFLDGKLPPEVTDQVSAAIASSLLAKNQLKRFKSLMRDVQTGASFDQAFMKNIGASPAAYIERWLAYAKR